MSKRKNRQKKRKKQLVFRLNLFFLLVFLLFSTLIIRLGLVQIVQGEEYKREASKTENVIVNTPVPRGNIYDRNGTMIVGNAPLNTITYTKAQNTSQEEKLRIAKKLAVLIQKEPDSVTERDLKDYWILTRSKEAEKKVSKSEVKKLSDKKIYQLTLDRITKEDLKEIKPEEMEIVAIKRELDSGYALTPQIVKNENVTDDEFASVSARLSELPGVDVTTGWERQYLFPNTFRSVLGNVTTAKEGLPKEQLDYFLARGYSRNDRVGKSQLEVKYENVLRGDKAQIKNIVDRSGKVLGTENIMDGQRGKDLILSIDINLQEQVEKILEEELRKAKSMGGTTYLDRAFVVMLNPKTGEVLAMAGKQMDREKGELAFSDFALGTVTTSYAMGSTVKGATVLTGFEKGVIKPGTYIRDEPLQIKGTPIKGSYSSLGTINDLDALKKSSNVYMFKTAMKIMGRDYYPNMKLPYSPEAFQTFRYYFSQFGLGVETGIDLPMEAIGFQGKDIRPGFLLDLAIGQYDTYTPMQLAQYVSTIANNGYRMKVRLVNEIRNPFRDPNEVGSVLKRFEPEVLNRISMGESEIKRVQEGFRRVMQEPGGTATKYFGGKPYKPAGKTGTAQSFYYHPEKKRSFETYNLTLVGYAPYNDPQVAFSIVVPYLDSDKNPINKYIGQRILDAYFGLNKIQNN
ncbi:peptidoglycan D,D-transpeptidase FtsI family protein [Bacillus songklensis]|uniref:serine-type D-Ala-D-Ala carboxypeptidase n=1 Tax=Bacillus songklensis TaxID=1069116 RepID=A0ABV8B4P2_9BACI